MNLARRSLPASRSSCVQGNGNGGRRVLSPPILFEALLPCRGKGVKAGATVCRLVRRPKGKARRIATPQANLPAPAADANATNPVQPPPEPPDPWEKFLCRVWKRFGWPGLET